MAAIIKTLNDIRHNGENTKKRILTEAKQSNLEFNHNTIMIFNFIYKGVTLCAQLQPDTYTNPFINNEETNVSNGVFMISVYRERKQVKDEIFRKTNVPMDRDNFLKNLADVLDILTTKDEL